jgi:hypothetical protein
MSQKNRTTILMYGRSGSGKTAQIGELAKYVAKTLGKRTRLYTADRGGLDTIQPLIDIGVIDLVPIESTNPFVFLNKAVRGYVRDGSGKWIPGDLSNTGLVAFESFRSLAERIKQWMEDSGLNIGGTANQSFQVNDASSGEQLKIGGGNIAQYGITQSRITSEVWESQQLPVEYLIWTSSVSKDEDTTTSGKVLGPDVIGKALTAEVPRWFHYTFRLDTIPAQQGKEERHLLYLGSHVDVGAGNATGLGNTRMPLDAPKLSKTVIEPASIVEALRILDESKQKAVDVLKKQLTGSLGN